MPRMDRALIPLVSQVTARTNAAVLAPITADTR
jgi:hypothetical protein